MIVTGLSDNHFLSKIGYGSIMGILNNYEIINTFAPWNYLYNNEIIITPGYYLNDKLLYYNNIDINDILKIQSIDDISKKIKETRDIKVKTLKL